jgi:hypothetical protein
VDLFHIARRMSSEHAHKLSGSVKIWDYIDKLSDCKLLEEDSAPWKLYVSICGVFHIFSYRIFAGVLLNSIQQ